MGRFRVEHLVPATAVLVVLLVAAGLTGAQAPDGGGLLGETVVQTLRWIALGLLAAPALMVYLHRWAAAAAAVVCAGGWASLGLGYGWGELLPCAYALVAVLVARHRPAPHVVLAAAATRPAMLAGRMPAVAAPTAGLGAVVLTVAVVAGVVVGWRGEWPGLAAVIVALGTGAALLARADQRRRGLRALFATDQPVREARVVDQLGYLHVLVPARDGRTAVEFGINTADTWSTWDPEDGDPQTRPALLYGEPRPGAWCAVEVDGQLHIPVEPVGETAEVAYDAEHGLPREVTDDEDQLADPAELTAEDRLPGVHEHRIAPLRAWFSAVVIGLGSALAFAELLDLLSLSGTWVAVGVVALTSAAGYEFGWRHQVRPRLRWHAGGIAATGFRGTVREPWTVDSAAVHDDEGAVTIIAGDSVLTVAAPRPWPSWAGQRTEDQLVAALRDARNSAFFDENPPPPPEPPVVRRPLLLYVAWAVTVAGAVALFGQ